MSLPSMLLTGQSIARVFSPIITLEVEARELVPKVSLFPQIYRLANVLCMIRLQHLVSFSGEVLKQRHMTKSVH